MNLWVLVGSPSHHAAFFSRSSSSRRALRASLCVLRSTMSRDNPVHSAERLVTCARRDSFSLDRDAILRSRGALLKTRFGATLALILLNSGITDIMQLPYTGLVKRTAITSTSMVSII